MPAKLGAVSLGRLAQVHPDLQRWVHRVAELSEVDFTVLEGKRTMARQRMLVATGKSQTLRSRHLTGHAVDLVPWVAGAPLWDMALCRKIAAAGAQASAELGIPVEWGGNWTTFKDGPHFQLPWKDYPIAADS